MDETDLTICRALLENSRVPYSKLGKTIGLTAQAVQQRVQALVDQGVITGTVTRPSFNAIGRMWVFIYGLSRSPSMDEVSKGLEAVDNVIVLMIASGNNVFLQCMAKDASELANLVSSVQNIAQLRDPQVGIVPTPPSAAQESFSELDLRLLRALRMDARKPVSALATEVGITAKTVRKRLDRLTRERLVNFSVHWSPERWGDTIVQLQLGIREDVQREKVAVEIVKRLAPYTLRTQSFSNLPNQIVVTMWTNDMRHMEQICHELEETRLFSYVVPNMIRGIRYYDEHFSKVFPELRSTKASR